MVKVYVYLIIGSVIAMATTQDFNQRCLACHQAEKIPDRIIYRRYLEKYSTHDRIARAMERYLRNPSIETSVMPRPFFNRFPQKKKKSYDTQALRHDITLYIKRFDMIKRLRLEPSE